MLDDPPDQLSFDGGQVDAEDGAEVEGDTEEEDVSELGAIEARDHDFQKGCESFEESLIN